MSIYQNESLERLDATPLLDVGANHAEGCIWDDDQQRLLFVDIESERVTEYRPESGRTKIHMIGGQVTDVHPTTEPDQLLIATRAGFALYSEASGASPIAEPLSAAPHIRMNDGNVSPDGFYFVGTMALDFAKGAAVLYRFDRISGELDVVLEGLTISNGIDWSPDGLTAYFADSPTGRVDRFDYRDGALHRGQPFVYIEPAAGVPDGLTVDSKGGVWVALFGGGEVRRYSSDGRLTHVVHVPGAQQVTSCCLGGPDLSWLFISTSRESLNADQLRDQPLAGQIFSVQVSITGKLCTPFDISGPRMPSIVDCGEQH